MNDEIKSSCDILTTQPTEPPRDASLWVKARYEWALWRRPWYELTYAEAVERKIIGKIGLYLGRGALLYIGYAFGRWVRWTPVLVLAVHRTLWACLAVLVFVVLWHLLGFGGMLGGLNPFRKFRQYRRHRRTQAYRPIEQAYRPIEGDPFDDDPFAD